MSGDSRRVRNVCIGHDYFPMFREYKTFTAFLALWAVPVCSHAELPATPEAEETAPLHLTLDAVVERIKDQNLQLLINKESVVRALEQSYQRRAALLPQFGIRAQQTRQQLSRGFTSEAFDTPPFNSFYSRVETTLSVFDTQRYADFKIAQLSATIADLDYEVATQDILEQAVLVYFTQLRDLRAVEIVTENLRREQSLLDLASQRFEAGDAVKIDVTRAEVRVSTERRSLMEAEIAVANSILELKGILDLDLDREVTLDRSLIAGVNAPPSLKKYGAQENLTELRPELQSQEKQLEQATLASKAAQWQRLPTVELFADWGYDSNEAFDGDEGEAWLLGIRASVPIWEGGRIAAEKREADAAMRQNEYQMRDLRNEIEREFRFSLLEMESRYAQIEIASEEIRLGEDEVAQARERYQEGLADNRELIDAQQNLSDAERSHLRAIYLYGLSRLAFARSIGSVERVLD